MIRHLPCKHILRMVSVIAHALPSSTEVPESVDNILPVEDAGTFSDMVFERVGATVAGI